MLDAYIFAATRTPFGRHGGVLASVRPDDLLAGVINQIVKTSGVPPDAIEDVMVGCANQAGEDSRCIARHAALLSGLPISVGGTVLQRNCGSGLDAVVAAAHTITSKEASLLVSGGVESMSRAPFVVGKAEVAYTRDLRWFDSALGARFPNPKFEQSFGADTMPETADNLARRFGITRDQCDAFAYASQQKCAAAVEAGILSAQITPVVISRPKQDPLVISADEHPRRDITLDKLAKLKALYPQGVTTAGNASGLNDGAVGILIGDIAASATHKLAPRARILATGVAGVDPKIMGYGPVPASEKALARAGLTLSDMDVIEINEAFAAQVLGCLHGFGLEHDDPRINPYGGAIALGHPLGASGPRILMNAIQYLENTNGRFGLVSMCIGLGQGIAVVIERV